MGRIITPKYVFEMRGFTGCSQTPSPWQGPLPTVGELKRKVMEFVVSTYNGFPNEHIGQRFGLQIPSYACIRENTPGGRVRVEWKAPMFAVLPDANDFPNVAKFNREPFAIV